MKNKKPVIGIIMGSDSDLPIMQGAAKVIQEFAVPYELTIVSAHRTPQRMFKYAQAAKGRGIKVIIAGAGGSAHLPGMIASLTALPVIGVPIKTKHIAGLDSLLSIVQMPKGIPVATVAIGNAYNAGLLAIRILATEDKKLIQQIENYQKKISSEVELKAKKLHKIGYQKYLKDSQS